MEILGYPVAIGNSLGLFSFISLIVLFLLYMMRQKPFKKVIPSLIFLESAEKRLRMTFFFRKFIKDWLFLFQFILLLLLCLATLKLTAEIPVSKLNNEVVFVIDASASSKAIYDGKQLFYHYMDIAKKKSGIMNSVVLVKSSPEIVVKQTNPINTFRILSTLRPSDGLSNIWDSMMIASDIAGQNSLIVVLSDFSDTSGKDIGVAKRLLEAKGFKVELVNPKEKPLSNIGLIKFEVAGNKAIIDVKNFDSEPREIKVVNTQENLILPEFSVQQFSVDIKEGINKIQVETGDDFSLDDEINIIIPKSSETSVLFMTSAEKSFLRTAFDSIKPFKVEKAEPPIISVSDEKIFVLSDVNYDAILPGTFDKIREEVSGGSSLIIAAQDNMGTAKLGDLLPIELVQVFDHDTEIVNTATLERLKGFDYGLSSRYYETRLKNNGSIVIAESSDSTKSPIVVLSKYGRGNILYYGIFDSKSAFKLSTQYPLFWINVADILLSKDNYRQLNQKVGEVIYGETIRSPNGASAKEFAVAEVRGIYKVMQKDISVDILNVFESDLNAGSSMKTLEKDEYENVVIKQPVDLTSGFIIFAVLLCFLEIHILKKRGDI